MEGIDFHVNDVKEQMKKVYFLQLRKILKSGMNSGNIMTAICAYEVSILCYTFRIMKWTKGSTIQKPTLIGFISTDLEEEGA
eukprot:12265079-Ditylum_brightwellii.AAC.1